MKDISGLLDEAWEAFENAPTVTCPKCGREVIGAEPVKACTECEQRDLEYRSRVHRFMREAIRLHIPTDRLDGIPRGEYRRTKAVDHVLRWISSEGRVLVLCGGVGVGKTFAAAVALWEHDRGAACKAGDLPMRWDPWGDEANHYERLGRGFTVLDDLGEEDGNARWLDAFGRWVDARHAADHRTIITTNLRRADLRKRYGDRVADRLNDCAKAVEIAGETMRRKGEL